MVPVIRRHIAISGDITVAHTKVKIFSGPVNFTIRRFYSICMLLLHKVKHANIKKGGFRDCGDPCPCPGVTVFGTAQYPQDTLIIQTVCCKMPEPESIS